MICPECSANGVQMWMVVQSGATANGWRIARCYSCNFSRGVPPVHEWTDEILDEMRNTVGRHSGAGRRIGDTSSTSGESGRHVSDRSSTLSDLAADYRPGGSRYDAQTSVGDTSDAQIRDAPPSAGDDA